MPAKLLLVFEVALLLVTLRLAPDIYHRQWSYLATGVGLFALWQLRRHYSWPLILFAAYLVTTSFLPPPPAPAPVGVVNLEFLKMRELLFLGLSSLAVSFVSEKAMSRFLELAVPIASLMTIVGYPVLQNTSLNAAFIVAALPFVSSLNVFLAILVCLSQDGASGWLLLLTYCLLQEKNKKVVLLVFGTIGTFLALHSYYFRETERLLLWQAAMRFLSEKGSVWVGLGLGTFPYVGPFIHQMAGFSVDQGAALSLHCDWLQLLFETGILGAALGLVAYLDAIRTATRPVAQSLLLFGILGVSYFPMRVPAMEMFCVWLAVRMNPRKT